MHITQKPVGLIEWLVKSYTNDSDLVLDNCSGFGTTGIACINTDRNFILMEKGSFHYDLSASRIQNHIKDYS